MIAPTPRAARRARVLVVEDDPDIAALLAFQLTRDGYRVESTHSGDEGLQSLEREIPDLVVLDRMLPGIPGDEVLTQIRKEPATRMVPVLLLTAKRTERDKIDGLLLGADDYLTKPFSSKELSLRVAAILRRVRANSPVGKRGVVLRLEARGQGEGGIPLVEMHIEGRRVLVDGNEVELTPTEFRLLRALMSRPGRTQGRRALMDTAWKDARPGTDIKGTRTVDMHILRLRRKLGAAGSYFIETVRGFGYRIRKE